MLFDFYGWLVDVVGVVFDPVHSWRKPFRQIGVVLFPLVFVLRGAAFVFLVAAALLLCLFGVPFVWALRSWRGEYVEW